MPPKHQTALRFPEHFAYLGEPWDVWEMHPQGESALFITAGEGTQHRNA